MVALCGLLLLLLLAAPACGGDRDEAAPPAGDPTATETRTKPATTTAAAEEPACDADSLLPAVQQAVGDSVESVEVVRCRDGHARATARPDESGCPPECYETADVLLRREGGAWTVVDYGTSIGCEEVSLPPARAANRRACAALGYPQPAILTGASFQLPSRNIGCRAGGGALRCDVLTGLRPEPGAPCELDWVGVVMEPRGPAEPLCAGDTAYDGSAQTLAYGDLWHRAPFWCRSSESGLLCVNRDLEGSFELARERWTAG